LLVFAAGILSALDAAAIFAALGVILYALKFSTKRLEIKMGGMEAKIDGVDRAVNNQPGYKPTLYQHAEQLNEKTQDLHNKIESYISEDRDARQAIASRLETYREEQGMTHESMVARLSMIEKLLLSSSSGDSIISVNISEPNEPDKGGDSAA
jgi:hypothetical protein